MIRVRLMIERRNRAARAGEALPGAMQPHGAATAAATAAAAAAAVAAAATALCGGGARGAAASALLDALAVQSPSSAHNAGGAPQQAAPAPAPADQAAAPPELPPGGADSISLNAAESPTLSPTYAWTWSPVVGAAPPHAPTASPTLAPGAQWQLLRPCAEASAFFAGAASPEEGGAEYWQFQVAHVGDCAAVCPASFTSEGLCISGTSAAPVRLDRACFDVTDMAVLGSGFCHPGCEQYGGTVEPCGTPILGTLECDLGGCFYMDDVELVRDADTYERYTYYASDQYYYSSQEEGP